VPDKATHHLAICPRCQGISGVSHPCECPESKAPPPCQEHSEACEAVIARADRAEAREQQYLDAFARSLGIFGQMSKVAAQETNPDKIKILVSEALGKFFNIAKTATGVNVDAIPEDVPATIEHLRELTLSLCPGFEAGPPFGFCKHCEWAEYVHHKPGEPTEDEYAGEMGDGCGTFKGPPLDANGNCAGCGEASGHKLGCEHNPPSYQLKKD